MRKKYVLTALAIFAVTGAVNHSQSLAGAWSVDGIQSLADPKPSIDHRLMDRGQLEWDQLIHTVDDTGIPRNDQSSYNNPMRQSEQGVRQDTRSDYKTDQKTDSGVGSSSNYSPKESSGSPTAPYGGAIYGAGPATPSADPLVKELSRDPSIR